MPVFLREGASIYYEERGSGFPLLLIAPGGMRSTIDFWARAAIDPWESYAEDFRLIAMDQRNAGRSQGPLDADDPWGAYTADQLGLLDHLGVGRFLVMGCCIGGSYVLKLAQLAPDRMVAGVLEQPIGVDDENAGLFADLQRSWAEELISQRRDLDTTTVRRFLAAMWHDRWVVSVPAETVRECQVPLLVLPGVDEFHPTYVGREIAEMAPAAQLLEPWKDTPEHIASATESVRRFLRAEASRS